MNEEFSINDQVNADWKAPRPVIDMRGLHAKDLHRSNREFPLSQEIHRDLQDLNISKYREVLDKNIRKLEIVDEDDLSDLELKQLDELRTKQRLVDKKMVLADFHSQDVTPQFARRMAVEEERAKIRQETTKIIQQIKSISAERAKLSAWNPLNWGRIRDLDNHLTQLKTREQDWQLKAKSNALKEKTAMGPAPKAYEPMYRQSAVGIRDHRSAA